MNDVKKIILAGLLLILISVASATVTLNTQGSCLTNSSDSSSLSWCYQETATAATSCGGLSTGSYGELPHYFYVTYALPTLATNNSLWQVKYGNLGVQNLTIPKACWDYALTYDGGKIQLGFFSMANTSNSTSFPQCYNGTVWVTIGNVSSIGAYSGASGATNTIAYIYDGDWNTYSDYNTGLHLWHTPTSSSVSENYSFLYEEGMLWQLQTPVLSYNVVFRQEHNGNNYNFNLQNQTYMQVVCLNYGSDLIGPLSDANYVFSTKEVPMTMIVRLNNTNGTMLRSMVTLNSSANLSFYLPQPSDVPLEFHLFHLSDYTKRFSTTGNSLFLLKRSVNNSKEIVNSQYFDGEQNANVYIYPDVPYEVSIYSSSGETRNYGFQTFNPLQIYPYVHSIDVVDVSLGVKDRYLFGNNLAVSFGWDYGSQSVSFSYNKTGSQIDSIIWKVYAGNQTPYYPIYNATVYNTQTGILQYTVPNVSWPYRMTADIVNDGINIPQLSRTVFLYNSSALQVNLNLPSELWGVSQTVFYNIIAFFILMCAGFAGTQIDAGKTGIAVTGLACMFVVFGWLSFVPWWMCTMAFIFSLLYELTKRRNVD